MAAEQLRQVLSVFAVVLGAAGDEGLAEFLQVDGIEVDPGIGFQEHDEVGRRLFQAECDTGLGMILAQLGQPIVERLGGSGHGLFLNGAGVDQMQISLAIGTVQANDQVIGMGSGHGCWG